MLAEVLVRFFLGGTIVSLFAIVGGAFKPKTLAGTFAAAPSVALVSLGAAYVARDRTYVALEARSMLLGAVAFIAYSLACVLVTKNRRVPVWAGALMSWGVWLVVATLLAGTSFLLGARS
jgi:hypothetical protein